MTPYCTHNLNPHYCRDCKISNYKNTGFDSLYTRLSEHTDLRSYVDKLMTLTEVLREQVVELSKAVIKLKEKEK